MSSCPNRSHRKTHQEYENEDDEDIPNYENSTVKDSFDDELARIIKAAKFVIMRQWISVPGYAVSFRSHFIPCSLPGPHSGLEGN